MRPPTEASRTSGSAAMARLEGQQRPLSGSSQPMKKKERDSGTHVQSSLGGGGGGSQGVKVSICSVCVEVST